MDTIYINEILEAKKTLANVNWNFATPFSVGRSGLPLFDARKYHWYPATFIPEIPFTLIDVLSKPGCVIYDPFSGIGTTLFQSLILERFPYGTETNRVAVMIMQSIWNILKPTVNFKKISADIYNILSKYEDSVKYDHYLTDSLARIDLLRPWFNGDTFNQLLYLIYCESRIEDTETKSAIRIALSATLKTVCAQDRGWGCIADNVLPKKEQLEKKRDAIHRFSTNSNSLIRDIEVFSNNLPAKSKEFLSSVEVQERIFHTDVRNCFSIDKESIDLIITSPPYPNMTDYSYSQRLSYYWVGAKPEDDLVNEIGARRRRTKPDSLETYIFDMTNTFSILAKKLKKGGCVCLVLPSFYKEHEKDVNRRNAVDKCLQYFLTNNFILEETFDRNLPQKRRDHNQNWAKLEKEKIYIFRKE